MPLIDGSRRFTPYKVTLGADDCRLAEHIASGRNGTQVKAGLRSKKFGDLPDIATHLMGAKAELAVARLLGLRVNERLIIGGNKGGVDLVTPLGATLDVRFRSERGRSLVSKDARGSDMRADIFVLVWPGLDLETAIGTPSETSDPPDTYEAVGWLTRGLWSGWAVSATLRDTRLEVDAARLLWFEDLLTRVDQERRAVAQLSQMQLEPGAVAETATRVLADIRRSTPVDTGSMR